MRNARKITALGFVFTVSLAFPLTAAADDTLSGSCATTLQGARATGLVLDAGAPLNLPGKLKIALDAQADARQDQRALLALPVGDTLRTLGIGNSPQVRGLCTTAQNTVNAVGDTTQGVLGAQPKPGKPAPVPHEPGKPDPRPTDPGTSPGSPAAELNPVTQIDGGGPGAVVIPGFFLNPYPLPANFSAGAPEIALSIPTGKAPSLIVDDYPVVVADRSGTAQALVTPQAPARLPLLLAVLAVSVVAAGLLRAFLSRKPA